MRVVRGKKVKQINNLIIWHSRDNELHVYAITNSEGDIVERIFSHKEDTGLARAERYCMGRLDTATKSPRSERGTASVVSMTLIEMETLLAVMPDIPELLRLREKLLKAREKSLK